MRGPFTAAAVAGLGRVHRQWPVSAETPSDRPDRPSERAAPSGSSGEGGASGAGEAAGSASTPPPPVPPRTVVGAAGQGPRPPWWHRRRSLAAAAVLVAVVAGLAVILVERQPESSGATGSAAPEVTLQAAGDPGRDPYTPSVVVPPSGSPSASPAPSASPVAVSASAGPGGVRTVNGGSAGLYGGTEQAAGCDVAELSDFLTSHTDRGHAWAAAEGIDIGGIPEYLSTLTPVVLRVDTRVTNHGFVDGAGTGFQSVLQAGSAVLVDDRGVPGPGAPAATRCWRRPRTRRRRSTPVAPGPPSTPARWRSSSPPRRRSARWCWSTRTPANCSPARSAAPAPATGRPLRRPHRPARHPERLSSASGGRRSR